MIVTSPYTCLSYGWGVSTTLPKHAKRNVKVGFWVPCDRIRYPRSLSLYSILGVAPLGDIPCMLRQMPSVRNGRTLFLKLSLSIGLERIRGRFVGNPVKGAYCPNRVQWFEPQNITNSFFHVPSQVATPFQGPESTGRITSAVPFGKSYFVSALAANHWLVSYCTAKFSGGGVPQRYICFRCWSRRYTLVGILSQSQS